MTPCRQRPAQGEQPGPPVFLTWRLSGSLPPDRNFPETTLDHGQAFAALDRMLDEAAAGPVYFRQPALAEMAVEAIHHRASVLGHYRLHAFAVMPNHVHLLVTPLVPLPRLTRSLKGIIAKRAGAVASLTGHPFWQEEDYAHLVRDPRELERIRLYVENDPVRAGLVSEAGDYRWSSRGRPAGRSPWARRMAASARLP